MSTGIPRTGCVLRKDEQGCPVCHRAWQNPMDPNYRCNVSALVRRRDEATGETMSLMIDAGKTMRDAVLRWFPRFNVRGIDALLLTHGHADAVGGIDDLRDLQIVNYEIGADGQISQFKIAKELPVYLNQATFDVCKGAYPYLVKELQNDSCPRRIGKFIPGTLPAIRATRPWRLVARLPPAVAFVTSSLPLEHLTFQGSD